MFQTLKSHQKATSSKSKSQQSQKSRSLSIQQSTALEVIQQEKEILEEELQHAYYFGEELELQLVQVKEMRCAKCANEGVYTDHYAQHEEPLTHSHATH